MAHISRAITRYAEWIEERKSWLHAGTPVVARWDRPDRAWLTGAGIDMRVHTKYSDPNSDAWASPDHVDSLRTLLYDFLMLSGGRSANVKAFVRKYGRLGLDRNGLPSGAYGAEGPIDAAKGELVSWYRNYARLGVAILGVVEALGKCPIDGWLSIQDSDREIIVQQVNLIEEQSNRERRAQRERKEKPRPTTSALLIAPGEWISQQEAKLLVIGLVNWWNSTSRQHSYLQLENDPLRWKLSVWGGGAWGAIGLSLGTVITRDKRVAECAHCGKKVRKQRRPRLGTMSWCSSLKCQRAKSRLDSRRSRAKRATAAE